MIEKPRGIAQNRYSAGEVPRDIVGESVSDITAQRPRSSERRERPERYVTVRCREQAAKGDKRPVGGCSSSSLPSSWEQSRDLDHETAVGGRRSANLSARLHRGGVE